MIQRELKQNPLKATGTGILYASANAGTIKLTKLILSLVALSIVLFSIEFQISIKVQNYNIFPNYYRMFLDNFSVGTLFANLPLTNVPAALRSWGFNRTPFGLPPTVKGCTKVRVITLPPNFA